MVLRLAHEVRNPLATIKAGVQLIQRLTEPNDALSRHFASVLTHVGRIDLTVHGMQKFVRLNNPAPERLGVERLVGDAVSFHESVARRNQVETQVIGGAPATIWGDPDHLRSALSELLGNAIRFSPSGSVVTISWAVKDALVTISVDDEGPGIPPEHEDRIMRPFFSTSTQGTGLGLNIAEKACRLAGGKLTWRNHPGRGCRFSLAIPEA
jgi:two-component system sensor histidine kinase SenX3